MSKLSTRTKWLYGIGFSSRGIKDGLFQLFLFFYFSQVLGLDAALAGTASVIALLFDAVSDPLVGLFSDQWKSKKWGRRHPFMAVSAVPLGVFTYLLFLPPEGLGQTGLFLWLLVFAVLVRLALTFFVVPHMSLGAELTSDYKERTTVTSYRIMFAAFVSPAVLIFGLTTFFKETEEYSNGLFNAEAYPKFALLCGSLMIITILITVFGTRDVIPNLPVASKKQQQQNLMSLLGNLGLAFKMRSFTTLVFFIMIIHIGVGIGVTFTTYFTTYFFELSAVELAALPIGSALGGILALLVAPSLGERLDKKWAAMWTTLGFGVFFSLPFNGRLLELWPENGSSLLVPAYVLSLLFAYTFFWSAMGLVGSMMADVVDEFELQTSNRQEGLFFAAMSFAYKCTNGLGTFIAGLLLNWIAFPKQAEIADVPAEAIRGLGLVGGPFLIIFYLLSILFIIFYPITRSRYKEIREGLRTIEAHTP